jgi:hypothetical protein
MSELYLHHRVWLHHCKEKRMAKKPKCPGSMIKSKGKGKGKGHGKGKGPVGKPKK